MTERVFVDTCVILEVFLGPASTNPERLEACQWVMRAASAGTIDVYVSPLVAAETIGHHEIRAPHDDRGRDQLAKALRYFESTAVHLVEIDRLMMLRAMDLCVELGLKGADAIHVACALRAECEVLYTYDGDMLKRNGAMPDLRFEIPVVKGQTDLPFAATDEPESLI